MQTSLYKLVCVIHFSLVVEDRSLYDFYRNDDKIQVNLIVLYTHD